MALQKHIFKISTGIKKIVLCLTVLYVYDVLFYFVLTEPYFHSGSFSFQNRFVSCCFRETTAMPPYSIIGIP